MKLIDVERASDCTGWIGGNEVRDKLGKENLNVSTGSFGASLYHNKGINSAPNSPRSAHFLKQQAKDALMLLKIRKYWHKKLQRCNQKKVRYNCRQNLAR